MLQAGLIPVCYYPIFSFLIILLACWIPFARSAQAMIIYLTAQSDSLFVAQARLLFFKHGCFLYFNHLFNASIITNHGLKNESFSQFFSWFSIVELLLQWGSW